MSIAGSIVRRRGRAGPNRGRPQPHPAAQARPNTGDAATTTSGKLTVTAFLTLDGVYQAPGGPNLDRDGGFEHGGWVVPDFDDDMVGFINEVFTRPDAFVLGRRTYEIFSSHWPRVTDASDPVASALNGLPK